MATIKPYTDINQSKKLAEILPSESADMCYEDDISVEFGHGWHPQHTPCWSLAALMEIIRTKSFNNQSGVFMGKTEPYCVFCGSECQTKVHNEPVDACVEMIEKLHELNLL